MNKEVLSNKEIIYIGLMIFALFFGAGNLIFPPELGDKAGESIWYAIFGFLISGIGLPILGLLSIAIVSKTGSTEELSKKVHPVFAILLTSVTYLAIGPLFAGPRTAVVSYELAITPFLANKDNQLSLFIFSIIYFAIVYYLAIHPSKFVDRFGKIITPILLVILFSIIMAGVLNPFNIPGSPDTEFQKYPFFKGITEGYLTMDTVVSIVFASIIINAIRDKGIFEQKNIKKLIFKSSLFALICLALVYIGLAYIGATSSKFSFDSGAEILSGVSMEYFGVFGNILLGITILLACIPTGAGLLSSCALYFSNRIPRISYKNYLILFVLFSALVSNIGLERLINISVPVLHFIYPIIIGLITMSFIDKIFTCDKYTYRGVVLFTIIINLDEMLSSINEKWGFISQFIKLPLSDLGFTWIIPAIFGGILGRIIFLIKNHDIVER